MLGELLQRRCGEIVRRWSERVRAELGVDGPTAEVVDSVPRIVRELGACLVDEPSRVSVAARLHAEQRERIGHDIGTVVREYAILADVLVDEAEAAAAPLHDIRVVQRVVTAAIADAVELFSRERTRELEDSRARLQAIVDGAPLVVAVKDAEGRYALVNRHLEALLGQDRTSLLGRTDREIVPEAIAGPLRALDRAVLTRDHAVAREQLLPHPDGTLHTYFWHEFPLRTPEARATDGDGTAGVCAIAMDVTPRIAAEEARRAADERFRVLLEGVRDYAIFSIDRDGLLATWNTGAERIMGYSATEIVGHSHARFFLREDQEAGVPRAILERAEREGRFDGTGTRVRGDGSTFVAEIVVTPIRDERGELRGFAHVTRDVTEKTRLARERDRALAALEHGDAFLLLDEDARILMVNATQERLSRRSRAETLGRVFWDVWPDTAGPDSPYRVNYERALRERVALQFEAYYEPLDLWTGVSVYPVEDGGIAIFFRDVTARRRAEQRDRLLAEVASVAAGESRIETQTAAVVGALTREFADYAGILLDDGAGGLVRIAASGRTDAGRRLVDRFAEVAPRLRGSSPPGRALATREAIVVSDVSETALRSLAASSEHLSLLREARFGSASYVPLVARGRALGVLALAFQRTGRASTPAILETSYRVADYVALALQTARHLEDAREAARARDDVMAVVAHDLRNPLAAISALAQRLARNERADETTLAIAARVGSSAERAAHLITDLLDATRARTGQLTVATRTSDLHEIVARVVAEHREIHPEREVVHEPSGDGVARLDPARIAQVASNLLGNALQHGAPTAPVVVRSIGDDQRVTLEVHNEGPPIPSALRPVLFEPFRRGAGKGALGLGLYITCAIARAHGGDVRVESSTAGGTTFTVELPRADRSPVEARASSVEP